MGNSEEYIPLSSDNTRHYDNRVLAEVGDRLRDAERRRSHYESNLSNDAVYPQIALDPEQMIVTEDFLDANTLSDAQKKLLRSSMLSVDTVKCMSEKAAIEEAQKNNIIYQAVLFLLGCIAMSLTGIIDEWVLWEPSTGKREMHCIRTMNFLLSYVISSLLATLYSHFWCEGNQVAILWNPLQLLKYSPIALGFALQDVWSVKMVQMLGSSAWKVIGQTKLVFTAILARIAFARKMTYTQWLIISTISMGILSSMGDSIAHIQGVSMRDIGIAIAVIIFSTSVGLICEDYMKRDKSPFVVQYGRSRVCGGICCLGFTLYIVHTENQWHLFPFGGYQAKYAISVINNLLMCFIVTLVVKKLDTLWKTLAGASALLGNYLFSLILMPTVHQFNPMAFLILLSISTQILAFASAKKDEMKILQLYKDVINLCENNIKV